MKNILCIVLTLIAFSAQGQYYYSDIIGTKQTNQQYRLLRAHQFKSVNATSYEGNLPSKDFVLNQTISGDGSKIVTHSATIGSSESYFTGYYQNNKIMRTVDSGNNAINTVSYEYDNAGRVVVVQSSSKDFDGTYVNTEVHRWSYNEKGLPEKMIKIKNETDTTLVTFTHDDDNVAEEKWIRNNRPSETYYYYYNAKKQLTDIVRYNRKARAMLPDYIFEYDTRGHIITMTQTQSGTANYLTWKYLFNEVGMKEKEVVFNKQKELLGRIEYSYQ